MPKSTKDEILNTLLELLKNKQLDDITVTELVEKCGISRQAFYYHFSDLYCVVDWALQREQDALKLVIPDEWWQTMMDIVDLFHRNRTVVLNIYRAYERSYVEHCLRRWIRPLIDVKVQEGARLHRVTEQQTEFVAELCSLGLVSLVLNWLDRGMPSSFKDQMDDFYCIIDGSLDYMLERLEQKNR